MLFFWRFDLLINSSRYLELGVSFSLHQKNIVREYKLFGKPGLELTYCVCDAFFVFYDSNFSHLLTKSRYQGKFLFPKPKNKNKILSCC